MRVRHVVLESFGLRFRRPHAGRPALLADRGPDICLRHVRVDAAGGAARVWELSVVPVIAPAADSARHPSGVVDLLQVVTGRG